MIDFKKEIAALVAVQAEGVSAGELIEAMEIPKYSDMGDFSLPCFKMAKQFRKAPKAIAEELAGKLQDNPMFDKVDALNGYLNFYLSKKMFAQTVIEEVAGLKDSFGNSTLGNGRNVIVEFSSPNIAKPFHMGHIRSTVIGNSLYRIYKALGYNTTSINHLGDYGTQFGKLIVAYKLWGDRATIEANPIPELLKIYIKFHEEAEGNPALDEEARAWFTKLENNDPEAYELWDWIRTVSLTEFNRVYDLLDAKFDSLAGESFYSDKMPEVLQEMRDKKVMTDSQGAEIVDLEPHGLPPALITKQDGSTLYITRDLAAAIYRKKHYQFEKNIYVVGAAQKLHFQQWKKILEMMGHEWSKDCEHVEFGMVSLEEGSLSTRKGRVVFLEEVLRKAIEKTREIIELKSPHLDNKDDIAKQVGVGAVIYQELSNNRIKDYTFSWERTLSFEGESGPYVQYTHARACSVLRKAAIDYSVNVDYSLLDSKEAMDLIRIMSQLPQVVQDAARKYEPALITRLITDLAQAFNRFYHDHSILVDDIEVSKARLALVNAVRQTLKNGLYLITMAAPEKM